MSRFYDTISDHYEKIFPLKPPMQNFLLNISNGQDYLDVGCATGLMAEWLGEQGKKVIAFDLNLKMVALARAKGVDARVMNMLEMDFNQTFDVIYCVGTTLAHLQDQAEVDRFLNLADQHLKPGGKLVLQWVNFKPFLEQEGDFLGNLPTIGEGVTFKRQYFREGDGIRFHTELTVDDETLLNDEHLYPIRPADVEKTLEKLNYDVVLHEGFSQKPFDESSSFAVVVEATKR